MNTSQTSTNMYMFIRRNPFLLTMKEDQEDAREEQEKKQERDREDLRESQEESRERAREEIDTKIDEMKEQKENL